MTTHRTTWTLAATVTLAVTAAAGCDNADSPLAPGAGALTPAVQTSMEHGLQDEYRAETIYQAVVDDLGPYLPFVNVLTAEQRHSASIAQLFTNRALTAPASEWTAANVPHFGTVQEACAAGVVAEQENIAMYDEFLLLDLPADVRQVFQNNRAASLVNHLPAFETCR